jgi:hypothetical protein
MHHPDQNVSSFFVIIITSLSHWHQAGEHFEVLTGIKNEKSEVAIFRAE